MIEGFSIVTFTASCVKIFIILSGLRDSNIDCGNMKAIAKKAWLAK